MLPAPDASATWAGRPSNVIGPSDALPMSKYVMAASSLGAGAELTPHRHDWPRARQTVRARP